MQYLCKIKQARRLVDKSRGALGNEGQANLFNTRAAIVQTAAELPVLLIYDIDPTWSAAEQEEADRESRRLGYAMRRRGHSVSLLPVRDADLKAAVSGYDPREVLVFNWCESMPGLERSEPLVARTLEKLGFTYTGASFKTLQFSYDKARVKRRLDSRRIPTPKWRVYNKAAADGWSSFPAIVKPAYEHCSVGVDGGAVVSDASELLHRVEYVLDTFHQAALVEDFIDGREFHVSVWGNDPVEVLPPVEMDFSCFDDFHKRLCSRDAKFAPDSEAYQRIKSIVPARLSEQEAAELEAVCKAAYTALECRDYGRIDVRLRDGVFYVLDVNPNADISADASVALAAGKVGYCYGAVGSRVVEYAAERHLRTARPTNSCTAAT